jgi:ubiquinone/menaquinone biosynthesis C-methylase UbiE
LTCVACQAQFPFTLGIPDLLYPREATDEMASAMVAQLLSLYHQADSKELSDIRLTNVPTYYELKGHHLTYMLHQKERGPAMIGMFLPHWTRHSGQGGRGIALDLGCGLGPSLLTLAGKYQRVVGLDPSLPDLILAKRLLEHSGILNVRLVQAQGHCLPFPQESIDKVFVLNVLEHLIDLESVLHECFRVLRRGGGFATDSRNRM